MADITTFFYPWQNLIYFILFVLILFIIIILHLAVNVVMSIPSILTAFWLSKKSYPTFLKLLTIIPLSLINTLLICYLYLTVIFPALSMKCERGYECATLGLIIIVFVAPLGLFSLAYNIFKVLVKKKDKKGKI